MARWRTLLYVPAHREELALKALSSDADCIILDLEDAVSPEHKDRARSMATETLITSFDSKAGSAKPIIIRINAPSSPWFDKDLSAIANATKSSASNFAGVRIPKTEDTHTVVTAAKALGEGTALHLLIESALGLARLNELANAHPQVASLSLGEADLKADLGWTNDLALDLVRVQLTIVSRAANLSQPSASVFTNVKDTNALIDSTERFKSLGFFGRSVIHPIQISPVNDVFTPTESEVAHAREILAEAHSMSELSTSAFLRADGKFIDPALIRQAQSTVDLHEQLTDNLMNEGTVEQRHNKDTISDNALTKRDEAS